MVDIRHYSETDVPVLERLVAQLHETVRPFDRYLAPADAIIGPYFAYLRERVRATGGTFLIAEDKGEAVGYLCLFGRVTPAEPDQYAEPYAVVSDLYVVPAYRRREVGQALMREAEACARVLGARRIELAVLAGNRSAIGFYRRQGYRQRIMICSKPL